MRCPSVTVTVVGLWEANPSASLASSCPASPGVDFMRFAIPSILAMFLAQNNTGSGTAKPPNPDFFAVKSFQVGYNDPNKIKELIN